MKRYVKSARSTVRIEVLYESYERYSRGSTYKDTFTGIDLTEALKRMCDDLLLYLTPEEIDEERMTADDIIDSISSSNGDGCDFIIYIKDLSTGEFLLKEYYQE